MLTKNREYLLNDRQRRRLERRAIWERISENGTISAAVMVFAAVAAVVVANSDAYAAVHHFFMQPVSLGFGSFQASLSFEVLVNDFLMAIFFLLVGIELKYEMTVGELRQPRRALLPMLAAVGGVIVPACLYAVFNRGGELAGWAIPMATDIAFALGVLSLLGSRVPSGVRVFFSTLAIADDLISIAAIALFYGHSPHLLWLAAAAGVTLCLVGLNRMQRFALAPYILLGLVLWFCLFCSGVHATLAGVILAFTIPARSDIQSRHLTGWLEDCLPELEDRFDDEAHILGQHDFTHAAAKVERVMHRVTPPLIRLERMIATPVNFIILPLFAFVNAQVRLVDADIAALVCDPITLGTYFGMIIGKPVGIVGVTALMVKTGLAELPDRVSWGALCGVGVLGGIGFTMSILISGLAFPEAPFEVTSAKAAILAASVTAAVLGMVVMSWATRKHAE